MTVPKMKTSNLIEYANGVTEMCTEKDKGYAC